MRTAKYLKTVAGAPVNTELHSLLFVQKMCIHDDDDDDDDNDNNNNNNNTNKNTAKTVDPNKRLSRLISFCVNLKKLIFRQPYFSNDLFAFW